MVALNPSVAIVLSLENRVARPCLQASAPQDRGGVRRPGCPLRSVPALT